jgi:hypothetical protein
MGKINVFRIVKDHFGTLRDYRTGEMSLSDVSLFIGAPLALGGLVWWKHFNFDATVLNGMLAAFSIFAGLLLNLLVLVFSFAGNPRFVGSDPATVTRRRLILEIHENLSFSILVAIAVAVLSLAGLCEMKYAQSKDSNPIISVGTAILLGNFILTLLMVLKRIHILLSTEFERPSMRKSA